MTRDATRGACAHARARALSLSLALSRARAQLYPPFLHIYGPVKHSKKSLFLPFIPHNRHKLVLRMLTARADMPEVVDGDSGEKVPNPLRGAGLNVRLMDDCMPMVDVVADEESGTGPRLSTIMVLHDPLDDPESTRAKLYSHWICGSWLPWNAPIHRIREYFGDQTGFYFLFISTFTTHCVPLGIVGILINTFYLTMDGKPLRQQAFVAAFGPSVTIAMGYFIASFRRKQCVHAKEWGCFAWGNAKPRVRPAFKGVPTADPIDGHIMYDFRPAERAKRTRVAWIMIFICCLIVIGAIGFIYVFKWWALHGNWEFGSKAAAKEIRSPGEQIDDVTSGQYWGLYMQGPNIATALNAAQVSILNELYEPLAIKLTQWENWKTDADYSNNLIAKLFLFKSFNTFAPIVYTAFGYKWLQDRYCDTRQDMCEVLDDAVLAADAADAANSTTPAPTPLPTAAEDMTCNPVKTGCIDAVTSLLRTLFVVKAATSFMKECVMPWLKLRKIRFKTGGKYGKHPHRAAVRRQFLELTEYDNIEGPIGDYMELLIQFGFLTLFGCSFAFSPFLCFALNMFQIKQDGYKLLFLNRKPVPMEVKSIGVWEHIYAGFVNLSAITNVGIICFTSDLLNDWSVLARLSTFVFGVLFTYLILHFVHKGLPPESEAVSVQLKRQARSSSLCRSRRWRADPLAHPFSTPARHASASVRGPRHQRCRG